MYILLGDRYQPIGFKHINIYENLILVIVLAEHAEIVSSPSHTITYHDNSKIDILYFYLFGTQTHVLYGM